jgi:glycosyltransferase involved in cell wall biosynthesis
MVDEKGKVPEEVGTQGVQENEKSSVVLSVVMPAYNEENSIEKVILEHVEVLNTLQEIVKDWEIVCLDDGSTDRTAEIIEGLTMQIDRLRFIKHSKNKGISESFRDLYNAARGTHIYATASDGQWPAANLAEMLKSATTLRADLVVGVRQNRKEVYGLGRRIVSDTFNFLPRLLFGVKTADAGSVKLGIREIFLFELISRSLFIEAERIVKAQQEGYHVDFVSIDFLSRSKGKATGAKLSNIIASSLDCCRCLRVYGFRSKKQKTT